MSILWVCLGGAIGAALRYLVVLWITAPVATLFVNVLGSFAMGLAFAYLSASQLDRVLLFSMTGLLGGFTTFSAFSLDVYKLWQSGAVTHALGYALLSPLLSISALFLALWLARGWA